MRNLMHIWRVTIMPLHSSCLFRVHFNRFVGTPRNEPGAGSIKGRTKYTRFGIKRAGLGNIRQMLEGQPGGVIPHGQSAIISSRKHDSFLIDSQSIDYCLVADEVMHEDALRAFPFFYVIAPCTRRGEAVFCGVDGKRANGLFVVRESSHAFPRREVPESDCAIHTARYDLRLRGLSLNIRNGARMTSEGENIRPCPHVPNPHARISTSGAENIEGRMNRERINTGEVSVIMSDDFVHFQIPTFDHLVFRAREQVWMPI